MELSKKTLQLLRLSMLPGIGDVALRKICLASEGSDPAWLYDEERLRVTFARRSTRKTKKSPEDAERIAEACSEHEISIISPFDEPYPLPLRAIDDFPPLLFVKGALENLDKPSCAVVGTRKASRLGRSCAKQIAAVLSENEINVVSGLALGIDTAAHRGTLEVQGLTVAVLAHGLDRVTPKENMPLAEEILDRGGLLVSEHPPGVPPRKQEYVKRNRIQSGMSVCSIIVESGEIGGTIYQADFTVSQSRRLICVVPLAESSGYADFNRGGADLLVKKYGAVTISSRADLEGLIERSAITRHYEAFRVHRQSHGSLI